MAKAVLAGQTRGYTKHPQLERFRQHETPLEAIDSYLWGVYQEAARRGYRFDTTKTKEAITTPIPVSSGQLDFERNHLLSKLRLRSPKDYNLLHQQCPLDVHPLFLVVLGPPEPWEKGSFS